MRSLDKLNVLNVVALTSIMVVALRIEFLKVFARNKNFWNWRVMRWVRSEKFQSQITNAITFKRLEGRKRKWRACIQLRGTCYFTRTSLIFFNCSFRVVSHGNSADFFFAITTREACDPISLKRPFLYACWDTEIIQILIFIWNFLASCECVTAKWVLELFYIKGISSYNKVRDVCRHKNFLNSRFVCKKNLMPKS